MRFEVAEQGSGCHKGIGLLCQDATWSAKGMMILCWNGFLSFFFNVHLNDEEGGLGLGKQKLTICY